MSRYFVPCSVEDLRERVVRQFYEEDGDDRYLDHSLIQQKLGKDLKVEFDWENYNFGEDPRDTEMSRLLGYQTLPNGLTFLGGMAGGDWEHPVFFIIYYDGSRLRGYVPTEGNPWNTDTKQAYGNDEEKDIKNARKRWPGQYQNTTELDGGDFDFEPDLIEKDIRERILPRPAEASLPDRVRALVYHGDQDKALELFQESCRYCHKLYGLGLNKEAETVYRWAESMARASQKAEEGKARSGVWGE